MTMNATKAEVLTEDPTMKAMVDRFLNWKLPQSFQPDCGISFNPHPGTWPIGTNVFTATEARQMLEHVVGAELASLRASRDEWQKAVEAKQKWMVQADAEIKRLEGELSACDAVMKEKQAGKDAIRFFKAIGSIDDLISDLESGRVASIINFLKKIVPLEAEVSQTVDALDSALAQVSAPAPTREQAKDECNCDLRDRQWNPVTKRCNFCHRPIKAAVNAPAPAAPATSEEPCRKCDGAGWVRGHELDNADEATTSDTMTKYACDSCKPAPATSGAGEQRSAVDVMRNRLQGAFTVVMSTDSNKGSPNAVVQMIEEFIDAKLAALTAPKSANARGGKAE